MLNLVKNARNIDTMIVLTEHEYRDKNNGFFNKKLIIQPIPYYCSLWEDSIRIFPRIKVKKLLKHNKYGNGGS